MKTTEEILTAELKKNCYYYNGVRWQDIGLKEKFIKAFSSFASKLECQLKMNILHEEIHSLGTPGNIANSSEDWNITAEINGYTHVFEGHWCQLGSSWVKMDGYDFLKAWESWGSWELTVNEDSMNRLYKALTSLTEKEYLAVQEHYANTLLLVESWNELNENTNRKRRCLGILHANFKNEKFHAPKPFLTNTQIYEEKGDRCLFSSTDVNGNIVLRKSKNGEITKILPEYLKEIISAFKPKPTKIIITHRILDQS